MTLIRNGAEAQDNFVNAIGQGEIPASGPVIVSLEQWLDNLDSLIVRRDPLGIRLRSDQNPEVIADDIDHFALIALEFPLFKDGRAYSYARLLRERWGFRGELRAVGEVLLEQLHFMQRVGFNSFELNRTDAARDWEIAIKQISAAHALSALRFSRAGGLTATRQAGRGSSTGS
jgi:uncharacterized protein (DUF934 family)